MSQEVPSICEMCIQGGGLVQGSFLVVQWFVAGYVALALFFVGFIFGVSVERSDPRQSGGSDG